MKNKIQKLNKEIEEEIKEFNEQFVLKGQSPKEGDKIAYFSKEASPIQLWLRKSLTSISEQAKREERERIKGLVSKLEKEVRKQREDDVGDFWDIGLADIHSDLEEILKVINQ